MPERVRRRFPAFEDGVAILRDVDVVLCKGSYASAVAKFGDAEEGCAELIVGENVGLKRGIQVREK